MSALVLGLSDARNAALLFGLRLVASALRGTDISVVLVERFNFKFEITRSASE